MYENDTKNYFVPYSVVLNYIATTIYLTKAVHTVFRKFVSLADRETWLGQVEGVRGGRCPRPP